LSLLLTIVITCYNEGSKLLSAYESLRAQGNQDFDCLIIKDFSECDETEAVCLNLEKKGKKIIRLKKNGGLSVARNAGFLHSSTPFVAFLDADDEFSKNTIESILSALKAYPHYDFYWGNYIRRDLRDGVVINEELVCGNLYANESKELDSNKLLRSWNMSGHIPCSKRAWKRVGGYRSYCSFGGQDVDFWMRVIAAGFKGRYIPQVIYQWNRSDKGMNASRLNKAKLLEAKTLHLYEKITGSHDRGYNLLHHFIQNADDPQMRSIARQSVVNLLPYLWRSPRLYVIFILKIFFKN